MKLHGTAVDELLRILDTYGGHKLLREHLQEFDLSMYEQQSTGNNVLVLTKDLVTELSSTRPTPGK